MFFSYTASVIMLSLAMYGIWCFLKDIWDWLLNPALTSVPNVSFLVVVRNMEHEIEDTIRYVMREVEGSGITCDVVVADCSSNDLTRSILDRLAAEYAIIKVVGITDNTRLVVEALPLCRGAVVHLLDLSTRLTCKEFMVAICALLRLDGREVTVKQP